MKRMTHDEFVTKMEKIRPNIEFLTQYQNSQLKMKCKCKLDNYEWDATPISIRLHGCPVCSGKVVTRDVYSQRLKRVHQDNIIVKDDFVNLTTKATHHCNIHNCDFMIMPYAALRGQGCNNCGKDKLRKAALINKEIAIQRLTDMYGDEFELCDEYRGASEKHKFIHHMQDGTDHTFVTSFSLLYLGEKCGVCNNSQISIGYNDIATTRPDVAKLFANKEDTYKYVELSNAKVDFICPNCSNIIKQTIAFVSKNNDLHCPYCSDGISYPNKLIYNTLSQIRTELDFLEREYKPDWCHFPFKQTEKYGIYDIYFGINGKQYIIEMDGAFHYIQYGSTSLSMEDIQYIDAQKTKLSLEQGIDIIRIDCFYPDMEKRFDYISNNILKSKLIDILDFNKISLTQANKDSLESLLIKSCNLWNDGLSIREISCKIDIAPSTVRDYLKSGNRFKLCDYSKEENLSRSNCTKAVVCLNTNKTYRSMKEAGKLTKGHPVAIQSCCDKKGKYSGLENGNRLVWVYLDDYNKMSKQDIDDMIFNVYNKKVVCISKNIVFANASDAAEWVGVSSSAIGKCCTGDSKTCGKDKETGQPLLWQYYNDYIKENDKDALFRYGRLSV